jgi:hypothetical protein
VREANPTSALSSSNSIASLQDVRDNEIEMPRRPSPREKRIPRRPVPHSQKLNYAPVSAEAFDQATLPPFDEARGTRNFCLAGLLFCWAVSIVCFSLVPWTFQAVTGVYQGIGGGFTADVQGQHTFFIDKYSQELIKLAVNICIAICTDNLGYIHSTSLRWTLHHQGKLVLNSNPRLMSSTRFFSANRWSTNTVSAFCLMLCYASSGQLFLINDSAQATNFALNGLAVAALGFGILVQSIISTMCLVHARGLIPTWSSNPLNSTLVCLHRGLLATPGRCMFSVHEARTATKPIKPSAKQSSMYSSIAVVKHVTRFIWVLALCSLIWVFVALLVSDRDSGMGVLPFYGSTRPILEVSLSAILITVCFQSWLTMGLHGTEIIVNLSRDEEVWRRATTDQGTKTSYGRIGSIQAAAKSWKVVILFILKAVMHWLLGLSLRVRGGVMYMNWQGVASLTGAMLFLAIFATYIAVSSPEGPQPAAYGHIQTLANLIDDWGRAEDKIFWGHKRGDGDSLSQKRPFHAGTSNKPLGTINLDCAYSGR